MLLCTNIMIYLSIQIFFDYFTSTAELFVNLTNNLPCNMY